MRIENIKFKAKRLDNGKWVCGYFYEENGNTYIIENRQKESMLNRNITYEVDPSTVCQFTGMKDSEGNEIWEGDLLTYRYFKDIYEVVWGEDDAFFKIVNTRYRERTEPLGYSIRNIAWCVVGNKFDKK